MRPPNDQETRVGLLDEARALLADVRCSYIVRRTECKSCGSARYDNFDNHQIRELCGAAIGRIEKDISLIEKGEDNEPQVTRKSRHH